MANGSDARMQRKSSIFTLLIPLVSHSQIHVAHGNFATGQWGLANEWVAVSIEIRVLYCTGDKRV